MRKLFLLSIIIINVSMTFVWSVIAYVRANELGNNTSLKAYFALAGIENNQKENPQEKYAQLVFTNDYDIVNLDTTNSFQYFSNIPQSASILAEKLVVSYNRYDKELVTYADTNLSNIKVDDDMVYYHSFLELPLHPTDYYTHKYTNALMGVKQVNTMKVLKVGESIGLIKDQVLKITPNYGYVRPPGGYVYGSGVCWTTSAVGAMMDQANKNFKNKYGMDLFVYKSGDRAPHGSKYKTYTNGGHGYTILQLKVGHPAQDYRITINPRLAEKPELKDLKVKFVMLYTDDHPSASRGQSIASFLISNVEF